MLGASRFYLNDAGHQVISSELQHLSDKQHFYKVIGVCSTDPKIINFLSGSP